MQDNKGGVLFQETIEVTAIHTNVSQEIIQITSDKLQLILSQHIKSIECRKDWIAPAGLLITLLTVFVTTEFKKFFMSADSWFAFFVFATILISIWLVVTCIKAFRAASIDDLVNKIKSGSA